MRNNISPMLRFSFRLICVLMIVLIQFPTISLGFEFARLNFSNQYFSIFNAEPTAPLVAFSNPASISVTDRGAGANAPNGISSPYPSQINVTGLVGTVSNVTVTLTNVTLPRIRDFNAVLVAPTGQTLMLMSDTGQQDGTLAANNVNLTFSDAAATGVPFGNGAAAGAVPSGTYRPTDVNDASTTINDDFPAPGPASINRPAPTGSATFASIFNGLNPNGNWSLYAIDDGLGGGVSTIAGGWTIDITTAGAAAPTTTTISSSLNPANTGQTITFTSTTTVTATGTAVVVGTVSFTNNGVAIAGCTAVPVNASGQATCSTTSPQGTRTIAANYSGTVAFGASSGSLTQIVNSPTVVTGGQFCNNGGLTLPNLGAADVYPVNINVSGLVGTISKVTTQVNGLTAPRPANFDFLLVGPTNAAFQFISDAADSTAVSGINLTLDDAAAAALPNAAVLTSGTYRPSDYSGGVGETDPYPAPAPAAFSRPAPTGAATFASVYNGSEPNGTWAVYAVDDGLGGGTSTVGGLCLNFTLNRFSTATTVTSSQNPTSASLNVTFTATVTASSPRTFEPDAPGTPTGSVEFFDGATSLGTRVLNGSGQATLTTMLTQGNHNITARYAGASVGAAGGGYALSNSGVLVQQVLPPTAATAAVEGRIISASGRGVTKAIVSMTDANGNIRYALTNSFGYYRFAEVPVGAVYRFSVKAKNMIFPTQVITVNEDINGLNFTEQN